MLSAVELFEVLLLLPFVVVFLYFSYGVMIEKSFTPSPSVQTFDGRPQVYAWLQVKLGNAWYNLDATFARQSIKKGKLSGDLFVSDEIFYGPRRFMNFLKGDIIDCKTEVGGHKRRTYAEKSDSFLRPTEIQQFMDGAESYDDLYRNGEKWLGSVKLIPYQGSSVQQERILAQELASSQSPVEI